MMTTMTNRTPGTDAETWAALNVAKTFGTTYRGALALIETNDEALGQFNAARRLHVTRTDAARAIRKLRASGGAFRALDFTTRRDVADSLKRQYLFGRA